MNILKISALGLFGLFVAACASAPPPPPPPPPPAPKVEAKPTNQIGDANALYEKGEYKTALASYDKILQAKPDHKVAAFNRAVTLHKLGMTGEAKQAYKAILAKDATDTAAAVNLGAILKEEGDIDGAISVNEKVLKADEFNSDLLNNLSVLQRKKKLYRKAIKTIRKLLMRDQKNIDAYKNLALIYFDQKKYKLSETILENARKMAKEQERKDPDIFVNLGMIYLAKEENGKAMAAFKAAIAIDPNHVVANYNIGSLALGHRDYNLAAKAYGVVAKAWPNRYDVHASLGYAHQGLQQFDEAAAALTKARELKLKSSTASVDDDEQMALQTVIVLQAAGKNGDALSRAEEYMRSKGLTCGEEDFEGFCGRYNGIKLTIQMEKEAAAAPPPEEEKKEAKSADQSNIFTDQPVEETEGGEGAEGAGAEGAETPPADAPPPADAE